jgi:hypothetical protein
VTARNTVSADRSEKERRMQEITRALSLRSGSPP